ncbi:MAG: hypothetical protein JWN46_2369 [Acidimicrobiales bacterium]|nr:hypothetical protein [Acidimicrobiales bacterium]
MSRRWIPNSSSAACHQSSNAFMCARTSASRAASPRADARVPASLTASNGLLIAMRKPAAYETLSHAAIRESISLAGRIKR